MDKVFGWVPLALLPWVFFCIFSLYNWSMWQAAMTVEQARIERPDLSDRIEPNWKVVTIIHGQIGEWPLGTKEQNPRSYHIACWWLGLAIAGLFILTLLAIRKRRHYEHHMLGGKKLNIDYEPRLGPH